MLFFFVTGSNDTNNSTSTTTVDPSPSPINKAPVTHRKPVMSYCQLVDHYKEKLRVFIDNKKDDTKSFQSLTSAQRKALYEVLKAFEA